MVTHHTTMLYVKQRWGWYLYSEISGVFVVPSGDMGWRWRLLCFASKIEAMIYPPEGTQNFDNIVPLDTVLD